MSVLASTVDEYFTDALSIAASNAATTSLGTSPSATDDLFASMGSLLSDDIWNKFGLDSPSDLFNFDMKELLDDDEKAVMAEMLLLNEEASSSGGDNSSSCGNESDSSNGGAWMLNFDDLFEIRNHDCMWAGHCGSKEHPTDEQPLVRPIIAPIIAARQSIQQSLRGETHTAPTAAPLAPSQVPPGRSVLLKTVKQQQQTQAPPPPPPPNIGGFSPDTPPMSDDEEIKAKSTAAAPPPDSATNTLQILQSVINDYDIKVDSDLCDYLEDEDDDLLKEELIKQETEDNEETDDGLPDEEEEEEEEALAHEEKRNQHRRSREVFNQFPSDHCYHKGTSLAYETPSDSDDEIDVVSISDPPATPQHSPPRFPRGHLYYHQLQQLHQQQHKRSTQHNNLPYNPSTRDRHQLQRTVATVMSKKKMVTGSGQQRQYNVNRHEQQQQSTASSSNNNTTPSSSTSTTSHPRVKTLVPHRPTPFTTTTTSPQTPRRTYTHHQSLTHGGKRKHPNSSTNSTPKYTRKRGANYHNSSDSEPEPSEKRSLHNNMERQRRIDLRNAFEYLRVLVPEVNKRERAAKVVILREARVYCNRLTTMDQDYQMQIEELKEHQERLRARVSQLRRSLANKHR